MLTYIIYPPVVYGNCQKKQLHLNVHMCDSFNTDIFTLYTLDSVRCIVILYFIHEFTSLEHLSTITLCLVLYRTSYEV